MTWNRELSLQIFPLSFKLETTLYIISLVGLAFGLAIVGSFKDVEGVHVYEIAGFPLPDQTAVLELPKVTDEPKQRSAL